MPVVAIGVAALAVSSAIASSVGVIALVGAFGVSLLGGLAGAVINFAGPALFGSEKPQTFGQNATALV